MCSSKPPILLPMVEHEHSRLWLLIGVRLHHGGVLVYSTWHILPFYTSLLHGLHQRKFQGTTSFT